MIKAFALCFSILLVASGMQGFIAFSFYKLNQQTIEQTVCVNKNKPQKKCHGKCYLKQKLLEQKKKQNQTAWLLELSNSLTLFTPTATIQSINLEIPIRKLNSNYLYPHSHLYQLAIDIPPEV